MGSGGRQTIKDSISQNRLRVAGGQGGQERVMGLWTFWRVCAMVSAVKCVNLVIHRPVPLGIKYIICLLKLKKKAFIK